MRVESVPAPGHLRRRGRLVSLPVPAGLLGRRLRRGGRPVPVVAVLQPRRLRLAAAAAERPSTRRLDLSLPARLHWRPLSGKDLSMRTGISSRLLMNTIIDTQDSFSEGFHNLKFFKWKNERLTTD